jgi:hypothetical protein
MLPSPSDETRKAVASWCNFAWETVRCPMVLETMEIWQSSGCEAIVGIGSEVACSLSVVQLEGGDSLRSQSTSAHMGHRTIRATDLGGKDELERVARYILRNRSLGG